MANIDSIRLSPGTEPQRRPAVSAARLTPFVEKALLFWGFSAAAGFWMAVIWWIVR
ncbi:MAG: hypothetical protein Q7T81_06385 [Pseudolabrys sp.]|nr:hypothetical protein [Pseudolabrys sp.]